MRNEEIKEDHYKLILDFNSRKISALAGIYNLCHNELMYYTHKLVDGLDCGAMDFLHDVLIKIWTNKKIVFEDFKSFKAYVYVAIRNAIFSYISHNKCAESYINKIKDNSDIFRNELSNSELLADIFNDSEQLPEELAKIIKYLISGYDVKEIAKILGKSESYVYTKRGEGISLLKKKKNHIFILLAISGL